MIYIGVMLKYLYSNPYQYLDYKFCKLYVASYPYPGCKSFEASIFLHLVDTHFSKNNNLPLPS